MTQVVLRRTNLRYGGLEQQGLMQEKEAPSAFTYANAWTLLPH
jgi:hypothetical protein